MFRRSLILGMALSCMACGSGGGDDLKPKAIEGSVVDGPIAGATIEAYSFRKGGLGELVGQGSTDATGNIIDLKLDPDNAPFVLFVTADPASATEVNGGAVPVLGDMKAIISKSEIRKVSSEPIYITPLTTVATNMALEIVNINTSQNDLAFAYDEAEKRVLATFGFGVTPSNQLLTHSPLIDANTDEENLVDVIAYRAAIEGFIDIVQSIEAQQASAFTTDEIVLALSKDLLDAELDGDDADGVAAVELAGIDLIAEVEVIPALTQDGIETLLEGDALAMGVTNEAVLDLAGEISIVVSVTLTAGSTQPDSDLDAVVDLYDQCNSTKGGVLEYDVDVDGCDDRTEDENGYCYHNVLEYLAPIVNYVVDVAATESGETPIGFTRKEDALLLTGYQKIAFEMFVQSLPAEQQILLDTIHEFLDDSHEYVPGYVGSPDATLLAIIDTYDDILAPVLINDMGFNSLDTVAGCGVNQQ